MEVMNVVNDEGWVFMTVAVKEDTSTRDLDLLAALARYWSNVGKTGGTE